jgi:hypothetical protein
LHCIIPHRIDFAPKSPVWQWLQSKGATQSVPPLRLINA